MKDKWLIEYDFEYKGRLGEESYLSDVLNKMIRINTMGEVRELEENQS